MKGNSQPIPTPTPASALRVGTASVCTTPATPVWLYGYGEACRWRPYEGKVHELYAKALAFEDAEGRQAVLVTVDLCVLRRTEAARVAQAIMDRTGLPPESIVVNLSHTHSGPMIGREDPRRWPLSPEMQTLVTAYTDRLVGLLADAAGQALADLRPAMLSWGRGRVGFVRNRRFFDAHGRYAGMKPNPEGFTDPRVTVLRVDEPDGRLRALVFSLACHAVTLGKTNLQLCGDYPGFARLEIEARHPGVATFFVQGCGADANSHPRATADQMDWARRHGEELALEVERVTAGSLQPVRGPLQTGQARLDLPLQQRSRAELETAAQASGITALNPRRLLELLDRGEKPPTHHRVPIGRWRFGDDLTLAALPGETVSGYIPRMEEIFDPARLWVAGYCQEVFGYLPTAQIVREGGYETVGLVADTGQFDESVEDVVAEGMHRLARQMEPERAGERK